MMHKKLIDSNKKKVNSTCLGVFNQTLATGNHKISNQQVKANKDDKIRVVITNLTNIQSHIITQKIQKKNKN